jgi:hypothetical protein
MSKFPLDLSKFHKLSSDKHTTTLEHEDGHQLRLAHAALHPSTREKLATLPMRAERKDTKGKFAEGGEVKKTTTSQPKKEAPDSPSIGSQKDREAFSKGASEATPVDWDNIKSQLGFAEGGRVKLADGTPDQPLQQADDSSSSGGSADHSITINVGNPGGTAPSSLINPNPGSIAAQRSFPVTAANNQAPDQPGIDPDQTIPSQAPPQPVAPTPAQAQAQSAGQQDPYGTAIGAGMEANSLAQGTTGIQGLAAAQGNLGEANATALAQNSQDQQDLYSRFISTQHDLYGAYNDVFADIKNGHIEPNHYLSSMGTGERFATGIGLILGGIGGGLTGQGNPALQFLNAQIDRDIDAQRADLGRKQNLLGALQHQFGNLRDATDMHRAIMQGVLANQLQQNAAKAATPIEQARANIAAGELNHQRAGVMSSMAMRQTLIGGANSGQVDPSKVVNLVIPEGVERNEANKELVEAKNTITMRDNLLTAFDRVAQLNTVGSRVGSPFQAPAQMHALKDPLLESMAKGNAGRFTADAAKMIDPLWPKITDDAKTLAIKRAQISAISQEKMSFPKLEAWGMKPAQWGRYPGGGASTVKFTPSSE